MGKKLLSSPNEPQIHEATLGAHGAVHKGAAITQAQAEARRRSGLDVVVCGPVLRDNRNLAKRIELGANGRYKTSHPHTTTAGPRALPHCQPDPRPPTGHTFYETPNLKAI